MYIYKTTNLINNKIYIGQSSYLVEESTDYLGSGSILNRAISKYGKDQFTKEILERDITNIDDLNLREIYYIAKYNSTNDTIGYNITSGGTGGDTISNNPNREDIIARSAAGVKAKWADPEYKAKMSDMLKGHAAYPNQQKATAKANADRVWSEESRAKNAAAQRRLWNDPIHKAKMRAKMRGKHWYHNPNDTTQTGQFHEAPIGWIRGRGPRKCN